MSYLRHLPVNINPDGVHSSKVPSSSFSSLFPAHAFEIRLPTRHVGRSRGSSLVVDPRQKEGGCCVLLMYANSKLQWLSGNLLCAALHVGKQTSCFYFSHPHHVQEKSGISCRTSWSLHLPFPVFLTCSCFVKKYFEFIYVYKSCETYLLRLL